MKCHEVMSPSVCVVGPETTALETARKMREALEGFACVCDSTGRPLGVIADRDLVFRVCTADVRPSQLLAKDVMRTDFGVCESQDGVECLAALLGEQGRPIALVVDGRGLLQGAATISDLLHSFPRWRAEREALRHLERDFRVRGRTLSLRPIRMLAS